MAGENTWAGERVLPIRVLRQARCERQARTRKMRASVWTLVLLGVVTGPAFGGWEGRTAVAAPEGTVRSLAVAASSCSVHAAWLDDSDFFWAVRYARSGDGGSSWSAPQRIGWRPESSALAVSLAADGSVVHVVWEQNEDPGRRIYYRRSRNGGRSWDVPVLLSHRRAVAEMPFVAALSGKVVVVWSGIVRGDEQELYPRRQIYLRSSSDFGRTWRPADRVTPRAPGQSAPVAALAGTSVHLAWARNERTESGWTGAIQYALAADDDATRPRSVRVNSSWGAPPIRMQTEGREIRLVFRSDLGYKRSNASFVRSVDNGSTWRDEKRINDMDGEGSSPEIAAANKRLLVLWKSAWAYAAPLRWRRSSDGGRTWSASQDAVRVPVSGAVAGSSPGRDDSCSEAVHLLYTKASSRGDRLLYKRWAVRP